MTALAPAVLAEMQERVAALPAPGSTLLQWFSHAVIVTFRDIEAIGICFGPDSAIAVEIDGKNAISRADLAYLAATPAPSIHSDEAVVVRASAAIGQPVGTRRG